MSYRQGEERRREKDHQGEQRSESKRDGNTKTGASFKKMYRSGRPNGIIWFWFQLSVLCHVRELLSHKLIYSSPHFPHWLPLSPSLCFSFTTTSSFLSSPLLLSKIIFCLISLLTLFLPPPYLSLLSSAHFSALLSLFFSVFPFDYFSYSSPLYHSLSWLLTTFFSSVALFPLKDNKKTQFDEHFWMKNL